MTTSALTRERFDTSRSSEDSNASRLGRSTLGLLGALALLVVAALLLATPAEAQRGMQIGINEGRFVTADEGPMWLNRTRQLGVDVVRVNIRWNGITTGVPSNPRNPADPAYDFQAIDRAVTGARQRGMRVLLMIYEAPPFAEGPNRPNDVNPGTWKPQPNRLAEFATAVATRYSGSFPGLPRIQMMSAWIEPNISFYLTPQWIGRRPFGARHYRRMNNAFYDAVKRVRRGIHVLTAGTAPFGDGPKTRGKRIRPMDFWREVLCMRRNLRPAKRCVPPNQRLRFDSLAHHPIGINSGGRPLPPRKRAGHRDEIVIANFGQIRRLLRAAERHRRTGRRGRHGLWAPEIWWQSKPRRQGVSLRRHAAFTSEGLFLLWKQGATGVVFLQLVDSPHDPNQGPFTNYQTGFFTVNGRPKPARNALRFPFVTERRGGNLFAWGRAPRRGQVVIQMRRRGGSFRRVARTRAGKNRYFTAVIRRAPRQNLQLRARTGGQTSMVWRQGRR